MIVQYFTHGMVYFIAQYQYIVNCTGSYMEHMQIQSGQHTLIGRLQGCTPQAPMQFQKLTDTTMNPIFKLHVWYACGCAVPNPLHAGGGWEY